ncbi:BTAD domain-containing putative transcriptional regulator [Nonomuraea sp. NPDC059194]|uniref:AfsR/SARP family transcriptional regulator n=1 Tax=Nonomuraea sp. NPDC059194 TaxID=3346764 RepID=UPI0036BF7F6B
MSVRFTVLGPVTVSAAGKRVRTAAPRHRAVLAYLLLHARTVISVERLIGATWGLTRPDTARAQIQASIAAIRQVLRDAGAVQLLETRAAGYVILTEPGQLDLEEFSRVQADPASAARQLRAALALWQGTPLADVNADYVAEARVRLEERRLAAVERLAELELSRGRHAQVVEDLTAEVAGHPMRERLCGQFMLALHRSGRQADALAAARSFRERLVAEQGLDPSRAFLALQHSILTDDPALDHRPREDDGDMRPASFLPRDIPDFTGRAEHLAQLVGGEAAVTAIDGMAGIGKTTLVVHAAHRLADRFPDGQLFVDLHAHTAGTAPVEASAALEILLRRLGLPDGRIPAGIDERAALWRAELADRRVLVVLDNAADTDHVRPLLPGGADVRVLITSRRRLVDLDGAHVLSMECLPDDEAVALFTAIVGQRAHDEPAEVLEVLRLCGFLPLAVRIAAARLRHRPRWTVGYLAGRLRDQRRRLAELSTADRDVAAAFTLSYQQLDTDCRRMFRLLGLHPGADLDPYAAAALADLPLARAEALLEDLLDAHMLLQHVPGRYTFHDLLRDHARATAPPEQDEALTRLFDHYLHATGTAVNTLYADGHDRRPPVPEPHTPAVAFADEAQAAAWLEVERANLVATAAYAADHGRPTYTSHQSITLYRYFYERAHHADALVLHSRALEATRAHGDRPGESRALLHLAIVTWRLGRNEEAAEQGRQALALLHELQDPNGTAAALDLLGTVHELMGEYGEAHDYYQRAIALCRELGRRANEATALNNVGLVYQRQGRLERAHDHCRQALELFRELGDRGGEALALSSLGSVYAGLRRYDDSRRHLRRALELCREFGYSGQEAETLNRLGETARAMGEPARALEEHSAALAVASAVGLRYEQARGHQGMALAHRDLGHLDAARDIGTKALDLFTGLAVPEVGEVRAFLENLPGDA